MYYCAVEPDLRHDDTKLVFRRGGRQGPIIATADPCPERKYQTDLHFLESNLLIPLEHKHHLHFCFGGKLFHWKGHEELVEDESGRTVAMFKPSLFEGNRMKIGGMSVDRMGMVDLVVFTALVMQERNEEFKSAVPMSRRTELILG